MDAPRTFHLHMISDATGETLVAVAKAVRVQYSQVRAIEHIHPLESGFLRRKFRRARRPARPRLAVNRAFQDAGAWLHDANAANSQSLRGTRGFEVLKTMLGRPARLPGLANGLTARSAF